MASTGSKAKADLWNNILDDGEELALQFEHRLTTTGGGTYFVLSLTPVIVRPSGDTSKVYDSFPEKRRPYLTGLEVRAQGDSESRKRPLREAVYGWGGYSYHGIAYQTLSVDVREAEAMAATLRRVVATLEKLSRDEGDPLSFGQFAVRVARALGIRQFAVNDPSGWATYGTRVLTLGEGQSAIDGVIAEWVQGGSEQAA